MLLKPGMRLKSQVCETQLMVVRAPGGDLEVWCGGVAMIEVAGQPNDGLSLNSEFSGGTLLGKRYSDDDAGLEVLCNKGGAGTVSLGLKPLEVKGAKALPSSD